jgi:hypothetical protein
MYNRKFGSMHAVVSKGANFGLIARVSTRLPNPDPMTASLIQDFTLPASGIVKFHSLDSSGNAMSDGYVLINKKSSLGAYNRVGATAIGNDGNSYAKFDDGDYQIQFTSQSEVGQSRMYTVSVVAGVVTVKDPTGNVVAMTNGYFEVTQEQPTLKFIVTSPIDHTTRVSSVQRGYSIWF